MRQRSTGADGKAEPAIRRLLGAAAADATTPELSEFFAARVTARATAAAPPDPVLALAFAARRLMPALCTLVVTVSAWGVYETARLERTQRAGVDLVLSAEGGADTLLVALLVDDGGASGNGDRR
jgi:hypothetical protein